MRPSLRFKKRSGDTSKHNNWLGILESKPCLPDPYDGDSSGFFNVAHSYLTLNHLNMIAPASAMRKRGLVDNNARNNALQLYSTMDSLFSYIHPSYLDPYGIFYFFQHLLFVRLAIQHTCLYQKYAH